jgi:ribosome-associated heat shock protein Hsp15
VAGAEQRIDKWLFFARVAKSRSLAQKMTQGGAVRVNREKVVNAAKLVRPGDVLTIAVGDSVRVLKILDPGSRRGPAPEAATLYEDLTPKPEPVAPTAFPPEPEGYVPSPHPPNKRERRALDRFRRDQED